MADTPKTPAPRPRRKSTATGTRKTARAATPRVAPTMADATGEGAATTVSNPAPKAPAKRASTGSSRRTTAVKPAAHGGAKGSAKAAATTVSRRVGKVAEAASEVAVNARRSVAQSAPAKTVSKARKQMGDRNFFAALIGGVAAVAATVGGILYAVREGKPVATKDKPDD